MPTTQGPPEVGGGGAVGGRTPLSGRRILVADDNHDSVEILAMLVRAIGAEVSVAYDGEQAVEAAKTFRPHVAVLDIGMPGMDGYEAARRIRHASTTENVRLVALTGWGQEDDRRRAREAGFDAHLVKPVDLDALREVLEGAPS